MKEYGAIHVEYITLFSIFAGVLERISASGATHGYSEIPILSLRHFNLFVHAHSRVARHYPLPRDQVGAEGKSFNAILYLAPRNGSGNGNQDDALRNP